MKSKVVIILISIVLFNQFSCTRSTQSVGLLLPNLTDSRYPKDRDYLTAKLEPLGIKVEVRDANNDPKQQESQAEELIANGVDVIIITAVNQNTAAAIVRMAHQKSIKVIAYERLINNCDLDYFIGFDHNEVGQIQGKYVATLKPDGNYVILGGDKGDKNAENIKQGQLEIIAPLMKSHQINIVYNSFIENWDKETAYKTMEKILNLSGEKIDVVISSNDNIASGAIKALNEIQPDYPVVVTGLDANPEACKRIMDGKQSMTVYKPFKIQAELAAELTVKIIQNKKIEPSGKTTYNGIAEIPTWVLHPVGVDVKNLYQTVIKDGLIKESEVLSE